MKKTLEIMMAVAAAASICFCWLARTAALSIPVLACCNGIRPSMLDELPQLLLLDELLLLLLELLLPPTLFDRGEVIPPPLPLAPAIPVS